jgi:hypothetical protein
MEITEITEVYKQPFDHSQLKHMVDDYISATDVNARLAQRDRDYFDGEQLDSHLKETLRKRGQPAIAINKIGPAISGILGIIDAADSDPEAYPRSQSSQDAADVVTKTLRYLADRANYKKVKAQVSENFVMEGTGAALLEWNGQHIDISRIRWEDFIHDPFSREHDFCDAKWLGVAKLIDQADARAIAPEAFDALGTPSGDFGGFFDETRKAKWWSDSKRKLIRVVDLYYQAEGDWHRAIFVQNGMLYAGKSDYLDEMGMTFCPIVATSFEIKRNGDRYGAIRNMIPAQDETNARRSRMLHLVNQRQTRQTDLMAPAQNADIAKREASKADGTIPYGFEVINAPDMAMGQMQLLQESKDDLDRMAPTPAVLGRVTGNNQSGRSRQILQQAGYMELSRYMSRLEGLELALYRKLWMIARQFLDQPTWVRIVDDPRAPEFLQINEPIMGPVPTPVIDPTTGQPVIDPHTGRPAITIKQGQVGAKNRLAELDMDIVISTVPDTVTLQQEVWENVLDYAKGTGISPFDPHFIALLEMSPLPNKRETIDKIKRLAAEQQPQQDGAQQAAAQQAIAVSQADVAVKSAKAAKDQAHAAKTAIEATALGASLSHIMPPEMIQAVINHGQAMLSGQGQAMQDPSQLPQPPQPHMPPGMMQ